MTKGGRAHAQIRCVLHLLRNYRLNDVARLSVDESETEVSGALGQAAHGTGAILSVVGGGPGVLIVEPILESAVDELKSTSLPGLPSRPITKSPAGDSSARKHNPLQTAPLAFSAWPHSASGVHRPLSAPTIDVSPIASVNPKPSPPPLESSPFFRGERRARTSLAGARGRQSRGARHNRTKLGARVRVLPRRSAHRFSSSARTLSGRLGRRRDLPDGFVEQGRRATHRPDVPARGRSILPG